MTPALLAGLLAALAAAPAGQAVKRAIATPVPGTTAVTLDRDVYDRARPDLGDLRVVDDRGAHVPYLLDASADGGEHAWVQPRLLDRGFVRRRSASVTLAFDAPVRKSELAVSLGGENFRRRVRVEGRHAADGAWTTLTDSAYVFAVPGPPPARYETVALPENDFERLRVTVLRGPDDPEVLAIQSVSVRMATARAPDETTLTPSLQRGADGRARETLLTLDLGARFQPVNAVVLEVATLRFWREVIVEAARDRAGRPGGETQWGRVGSGVVYRSAETGRVHERVRVEVSGRERALRLRIRDRDDEPLDIRSVTVRAPRERVVFEARAGRAYALEYGDPARTRPSYDLPRTVHAATWAAEAAPGALGEAEPAPWPHRRAWTERHPGLLMAGLAAAVAALGLLTWRALRVA